MAEIEILPQKIVDTKTIILKSRLDSNTVRLQGERLKTDFFGKFDFRKPRPEDVTLIAFNKYYEPYIIIGGKYSIDYCKRHDYTLQVEDKTQEIFIDGKKLKSEPLAPDKPARVIRLVGEEHSHYENETYLILDRTLQEVSPKELPFAPFEREPENQPEADFDLRRAKISLEDEITFLRSRIAKRPLDVAEVVREIFEINERTIIYNPIYELTFQNLKNGKNVTALINGISGEVVLEKLDKNVSKKLVGEPLVTRPENSPIIKTQAFPSEPEPTQNLHEPYVPYAATNGLNENSPVERDANVSSNQEESNENSMFNAEKATHLASDFLKRLGYRQRQFPTKAYVEGEVNVVELSLQKGTAIVQIDTNTKEVKGYEIQEAEAPQHTFLSKGKILFFLCSVVIVAISLKLMNIF
jgi:hypothetical protein